MKDDESLSGAHSERKLLASPDRLSACPFSGKKRNAWLITQDQCVKGRERERKSKGMQRTNGEGVEEIPRSWKNRKDFNDLFHLPRGTVLRPSRDGWRRERAR